MTRYFSRETKNYDRSQQVRRVGDEPHAQKRVADIREVPRQADRPELVPIDNVQHAQDRVHQHERHARANVGKQHESQFARHPARYVCQLFNRIDLLHEARFRWVIQIFMRRQLAQGRVAVKQQFTTVNIKANITRVKMIYVRFILNCRVIIKYLTL